LDLDKLTVYCLLLKEEKAYEFCNYSYTAIALQEFNENSEELKVLTSSITLNVEL